MAEKTITAANAVFMLSIRGLFTTPQRLQGFAADDVFDTESVEAAETQFGVDGKMSAGFVFVETKQMITLQADSDSINIFEEWYRAQQSARDLYFADGSVILSAINKVYTMTKGVLKPYSPMSDAKKLLQPRKFGITWESVLPAGI